MKLKYWSTAQYVNKHITWSEWFYDTDVAVDKTSGSRYRYRRQHVIQSLMLSSDESESSDSDSDVDTTDSKSR